MRLQANRNDCQIRLRVPIELKNKIVDYAKANGRSVNSEILIRLKNSFIGAESDGTLKNELIDI